MSESVTIALAAVASYIIGATPFGYFAGRLKGIDIRQHGSGNIGATNVLRVLGKGIGIPVFLLDLLKGLIPVLVTRELADGSQAAAIASGLGSILGHMFTFWLGFRGGKGIATSAGVLFGLMWLPALIVIGVWIAVFFLTKYVAVASIAGSAVLPFACYFLCRGPEGERLGAGPLFWFTVVIALLAIFRHRSNIQRLLNGTENRFGKKPGGGENEGEVPP